MAWRNVQIYLERKATYADMSIDSIFQNIVIALMHLNP